MQCIAKLEDNRKCPSPSKSYVIPVTPSAAGTLILLRSSTAGSLQEKAVREEMNKVNTRN
jgi:hypothetical protein